MRALWLSRAGGARLTLIFGGWGLGAAPFAALDLTGDVLFLEDYQELGPAPAALRGYSEVDLLGYSFGVAAAGFCAQGWGLRPARAVAVAGTLFPADARRGIAPEVIEATAAGLSATSFARFCRRAGLAPAPAPEIDIAARCAELRAIAARGPAPALAFDRVWLPSEDRIIPPAAQRAAWGPHPGLHEIRAPHCPFRPGQALAEWLA